MFEGRTLSKQILAAGLLIVNSIVGLMPPNAMAMPEKLAAAGQVGFLTQSPIPLPDWGGAQSQNQWIQIPVWLAGTWCASTDLKIVTEPKASSKGAVRLDLRLLRLTLLGTERDQHGRIWQYIGGPYERTFETSTYVERQLIKKVTTAAWTKNKYTISALADVTIVDKKSGQMLNSFQEKSTSAYEYVRDGVIQVTYEIYDYTYSGGFLSSHRKVEQQIRLAPFEPLDQEQLDLRFKLQDFLRSHHLSER